MLSHAQRAHSFHTCTAVDSLGFEVVVLKIVLDVKVEVSFSPGERVETVVKLTLSAFDGIVKLAKSGVVELLWGRVVLFELVD